MKKKVIVLQVDPYTKLVLTIIAICLAGMLLKPVFTVLPAIAQSKKLSKEIQDVNIALISGQPPEVALPLRVNIARSRTIGVKIEDSATVPVSIEKSATLPVSIEKPDAVTVNIAKSEVIPVNITAPDVLDARVVDSIIMPVEITAPFPLPVVQTVRRYAPAE